MKGETINAIIIENDPQHVTRLTDILGNTKVKVLSVCTNVKDAVTHIRKDNPDLVFLDIDLDHDESGFDIFECIDIPDFYTIVTTQYNTDNNFCRAIWASAVDFVVKPLLPERIEEALLRYDKKKGEMRNRVLKENLKAHDGRIVEVTIKNAGDDIHVKVDNIRYCKSEDVWTTFYLVKPVRNITTHVSAESIKHWENNLHNSTIMRVHNRYLANFKYVVDYKDKPNDTAELVLDNGIKLDVSRSRKKATKGFWNRNR